MGGLGAKGLFAARGRATGADAIHAGEGSFSFGRMAFMNVAPFTTDALGTSAARTSLHWSDLDRLAPLPVWTTCLISVCVLIRKAWCPN